MGNKKSKKDSIRNIIGGFFIVVGFFGMFTNGILSGIFMMLFGISLLPILYKKINLNKYKYIQIILPIVLIIIFGIITPEKITETSSNINEVASNIVEEEKEIKITNLQFNETNIEMDIKEIKDITIEIMPKESNIENLEFCTSNNQISTLEKNETQNNEGKISLRIKPIAEGNCEIYVKSVNGIESNKVLIKIIDNERIEKEKKEAEEQSQKKIDEEKVQQEESVKQSELTKAQPSSQSTTKSTTDTSKTVYITPTGKRYHYDPDCGGKNSYSTTLDNAKSVGLTPCQNCAK